ncbi:unnamed protein product [Arabidopsis arenosa]|uniref:Uncharacterized protein n=1 Tax=Arabidopsis arenosa TaxID=38785 RepID=A0A8S2AWX6_ARAAE|nr:unnamed protein product [Arabidopsis arenosa]
MNNVKGQGNKKPPCPIGQSGYGRCGPDGHRLCFRQIERSETFSKDVMKAITHCKCFDDRRNNVDMHWCACDLKHGPPC